MSAVQHQPTRSRTVFAVAVAALALALFWLGGLVRFAAELPRSVADPNRPTEGIVVLTGGAARINAGLELLLSGKAKRMFISGVNPGTSKSMVRQVAGTGSELLDCCVDLGFEAADTHGNALETAAWATSGGYRSLRIVTASYHMPRSLLELQQRMPEVELVAHPVFPQQVKLDGWWAWPGTANLLIEEYNKYLVALLRSRIDGMTGDALDRWLGE